MTDKSTYKRQVHDKLRRFGVTGPGRDWLLRALHPASEERCQGIPDQSATPVFRPDYRLNTTIQAPSGASSWDCFIWTPPGDVNAVFWATGPSGTDFGTSVAPPGCEVGVVRLQQVETSTDVIGLFDVQNPSRQGSVLTQVPQTKPVGFRHTFKSITITQIASAVSDQGQVYAAQYAPNMRCCGMASPEGYDSGTPDPANPGLNYALYGAYYSTVLPAREADITAMSPDFYMGASRDGLYMPLRLAGPSQPFARSVPSGVVNRPMQPVAMYASDVTQFPCGAMIVPTANRMASGSLNTNIPWVFSVAMYNLPTGPGAVAAPQRIALDSAYDNINIGVVIFRGLQGGGGGGFSASLQLKTIAGLEIAPSPEAIDRVFTEEPSPYEPRALEAYYAICLELKDAYPGCYNSLEDIWDAIKSVASTIWDAAKAPVQEVVRTAVPMIAEAGRAALMGGLTGAHRGSSRARVSVAPRLLTYRAPSVSVSKPRSVAARAKIGRTRKRK